MSRINTNKRTGLFSALVAAAASVFLLIACTASETDDDAVDLAPEPSRTAEPAPTATSLPQLTEAPPADDFNVFLAQLESAVMGQDYAQMQALMSDPLGAGAWRSEWRVVEPSQATSQFQNGSLPPPTAVQFTGISDDEIGDLLDQPPASLLGPAANTVAVLHSTGWGQSAGDEAILFVVEEDGHYSWSAFLYTTGSFASASSGFVAAPVGLMYRIVDDGVFQIQLDGLPQQLLDAKTANIPGLQVSPDGVHAAYLDEQGQLVLIETATGLQRLLAADLDLSPFIMWGDNDTLFVGVWFSPDEADGPNNGHYAVVDIYSDSAQILDEEHLSGNRPALLSDYNKVAFDVFAPDFSGRIYHPDSGLTVFDQNEFEAANDVLEGNIFNPAWAPGGEYIAWLRSTGDRIGVQVFALEPKSVLQIYDWDPARFGGPLPSPVWSPDGRWIALEVLANDPEGSGVWLLTADGSEQRLVDANGHGPIWINDTQLVLNIDSQPWLYDLDSDMAFPMDLPDSSQVIGFTDPNSLPTLGDQFPVVEAPISFVLTLMDVPMYSGPSEEYQEIGIIFDGQTALVTGQSEDGGWWRVICPDDSIGSCWVSADPASTVPAEDANQPPLPDPASLELVSKETLASPDGRWLAVVTQTEPIVSGDSEQFYASLSVSDGETDWMPVAEWRPYGLGYLWPAVYRWSADSSALYYTNAVAPDGCSVFTSGTDPFQLNISDGAVTEILPQGLTYSFALSTDETRLAYTTNNGQQWLMVVRDTASGSENSVALVDSGGNVQLSEIFWSADGKTVLLSLVYNACLPEESTSSLVRVDTEAMTAAALLEEDERGFVVRDWPNPDSPTVLLVDKNGDSWNLDIDSGSLSPG